MLKIIASIFTIVFGFIELMLVFRFALRLLSANEANGFVSWVYGFTLPFISPFAGIFNLPLPTTGIVIEVPTLIAIVVFGVILAIFGSFIKGSSKS